MIFPADELGSPDEPENAAGESTLEGLFGNTGDERSKVPPDDAPVDADGVDQAAAVDPSEVKGWYILKVQSNREDSIRDALLRRIRIQGLERYVDQVIVPTEKISQINPKTGKKRTIKQKLYPGYLVVHMAINDDTWFLIRETPGIGDFTGSGGKPVPMQDHEVARIVAKTDDQPAETVKIKIDLKTGDRVKIIDGIFLNFEGDVGEVDENSGKITVLINIFNRSTPVDLEYWQVEKL